MQSGYYKAHDDNYGRGTVLLKDRGRWFIHGMEETFSDEEIFEDFSNLIRLDVDNH